jgi:GT2 family glycosyltransferase
LTKDPFQRRDKVDVAREGIRVRKASVVVVTYNGLEESTVPCLESVLGLTRGAEFEVVVVDNHSSDGTPGYLRELAARDSRVRCLLNTENRGFAGGNNDGLRVATGDFIVLLNSDTIVTEGWLVGLLDPLETDLSVGLAGPVSNAVGNEQKISCAGLSPEEIIKEGRLWTAMSEGDRFDTDRLGFFCVATRRDVVDRVGPLDEGFGTGFFEDDDYCIRVREAGYRLVCVEDVFVYHQGSGSFGKARRETRELMKRNRKRLEGKFAMRYRPRHPRDRQLDLAESYLARMEEGGGRERLLYKTENRLCAAEAIAPHGWLKRYLFRRAVRGIRARIGQASPGRREATA